MLSDKKRHYTVCHTMTPKVYKDYLKVLDIHTGASGKNDDDKSFEFKHKLPNDDEPVSLTIKNYAEFQSQTLSGAIFEQIKTPN